MNMTASWPGRTTTLKHHWIPALTEIDRNQRKRNAMVTVGLCLEQVFDFLIFRQSPNEIDIHSHKGSHIL